MITKREKKETRDYNTENKNGTNNMGMSQLISVKRFFVSHSSRKFEQYAKNFVKMKLIVLKMLVIVLMILS
jgi:hypothetical protein